MEDDSGTGAIPHLGDLYGYRTQGGQNLPFRQMPITNHRPATIDHSHPSIFLQQYGHLTFYGPFN